MDLLKTNCYAIQLVKQTAVFVLVFFVCFLLCILGNINLRLSMWAEMGIWGHYCVL